MGNRVLELPGTAMGFDRPWPIHVTRGCTSVSSGCDVCAWRWVHEKQRRMSGLGPFDDVIENKRALFTIKKRIKPTWYSLSPRADMFHDDISDEYLIEIFKLIAEKKQHLFHVHTKYTHRMKSFLKNVLPTDIQDACENLMIGVNIETQEYAWRIYDLNAWKHTKIVELAPLLGPMTSLDLSGIDWITVSSSYKPGLVKFKIGWIADVIDMADRYSKPIAVDFISMGSGVERFPAINGKRWMGKPKLYTDWRLANEAIWLKGKP